MLALGQAKYKHAHLKKIRLVSPLQFVSRWGEPNLLVTQSFFFNFPLKIEFFILFFVSALSDESMGASKWVAQAKPFSARPMTRLWDKLGEPASPT